MALAVEDLEHPQSSASDEPSHKDLQRLKFWLDSNHFSHLYPMILKFDWNKLEHFERCDPVSDINDLFEDIYSKLNYKAPSATKRDFRNLVKALQTKNNAANANNQQNGATSLQQSIDAVTNSLQHLEQFCNTTMPQQFDLKVKEINLLFENIYEALGARHAAVLMELGSIRSKQQARLTQLKMKMNAKLKAVQQMREQKESDENNSDTKTTLNEANYLVNICDSSLILLNDSNNKIQVDSSAMDNIVHSLGSFASVHAISNTLSSSSSSAAAAAAPPIASFENSGQNFVAVEQLPPPEEKNFEHVDDATDPLLLLPPGQVPDYVALISNFHDSWSQDLKSSSIVHLGDVSNRTVGNSHPKVCQTIFGASVCSRNDASSSNVFEWKFCLKRLDPAVNKLYLLIGVYLEDALQKSLSRQEAIFNHNFLYFGNGKGFGLECINGELLQSWQRKNREFVYILEELECEGSLRNDDESKDWLHNALIVHPKQRKGAKRGGKRGARGARKGREDDEVDLQGKKRLRLFELNECLEMRLDLNEGYLGFKTKEMNGFQQCVKGMDKNRKYRMVVSMRPGIGLQLL